MFIKELDHNSDTVKLIEFLTRILCDLIRMELMGVGVDSSDGQELLKNKNRRLRKKFYERRRFRNSLFQR
mgnify:FL=1